MVTIIGAGSSIDPKSLPLCTKKRTRIDNEPGPQCAPETFKVYEALFRKKLPNAKLRSQDSTYNCVGLVFASRRTWIEPDKIPMILDEDGYNRVENEEDLQPGDIVVYRNERSGEIDHIGIILTINTDVKSKDFQRLVLSQWGWAGEYIHSIKDVPEAYGKFIEFWSEKKKTA